jgi:4-methyl-5(b-hydroxyethyl)-thiazole monophosphate biosynthesis
MQRDTTNILLFLARGFEDLEAIAILDVFAWTRYREHIANAAVTSTGFHEIVTSRCGLPFKPDLLIQDVNSADYQALVLPGGFHSHGFEEAYDARIHALAREIHQNGGYIATMCVGVLPIADAGLLKGKRATSYPYSRYHDNITRLEKNGAIVVDDPVVMDDRIISCSGPGAALEVAFLLMECMMGSETAQEIRRFMMYKENRQKG